MGATTRIESAFRFRDDDGTDETDATWRQLADVADTQGVDTNYRIRFNGTTGGMAGNLTPQLEYNLAGAGWLDVNATSSVVRTFASGVVGDGTSTTEQLNQGGTFVGGEFEGGDGLAAQLSGVSPGDEGEWEFCYQIRSVDVSDGQDIELKITEAGSDWDTYPSPQATVTVSIAAGHGQLLASNRNKAVLNL